MNGTRCWSILDTEPKTDIFFFDSFGLDGLKHLIVQDDKDQQNLVWNRKND